MPAKGKKLTKAEKEKLKKEEQERKEAEEDDGVAEEERQRLLEEEKRKKKEEKLLEVERQKLENEERKQRRAEMTELVDMILTNRNNLQAKDDDRRKQAKWDRYMRCDGSPDPTIQGEINTYINLKLESKDRDDADNVLKDSQLDLSLISELDYLLGDTPLEDLPNRERQRYRETIGELQHLIQLKLDAATLQVLCDASKLQDPETSNLQFSQKNDNISLCVWGNLSKNPRIKVFEFEEAGFTFDIPKTLTLSDCAIRFLRTKFDHFSPYSKAFYPRHKKKEEEVVEAPVEEAPVEEEQPAEEEGAEKAEGEEAEADKEDTMASVPEEPAPEDLLAALRGEEPKVEEQKEEEETEPLVEEDFEDPSTPEPAEWEDFDEEDDVVDLRAYQVVGGVFCFDLLTMPPQPKACKNWTITQLVDPPKIEYLDYVADPPVNSGQEKEKNKEKEHDKRDERPALTVTISLPHDVMFLEEPQIARWDPVKQYWRTDGFANFAYDEENRTFRCSVSQFGTMCLLQDTHINMPFQSWELRPHGVNSAVLTIIAAIVELEIEIKNGLCCLSQPSDKPELTDILNQWVTPQELVEKMQRAGLNVFPQEDSSKYVTVQNKAAKPDQQGATAASTTVLTAIDKLLAPIVEPAEEDQVSAGKEKPRRKSAASNRSKGRKGSNVSNKGKKSGTVSAASSNTTATRMYSEPDSVMETVLETDEEAEMDKPPSKPFKHPLVVDRLYEQMALVASAMAFSWSKWNSTVEYEHVVMQGSEALQDEPLLEEDWGLFLASKRRFAKLKMTEFDEEFSQEMATDVEVTVDALKMTEKQMMVAFDHLGDIPTRLKRLSFKSNLYHFLQSTASEAAKERIQESSTEFVDCVQQLLKATQVLTYA